MEFTIPADLKGKIKNNEKSDEYLDFVREVKTLSKMIVIAIPVMIGAPRTIPKGLIIGLEELEIEEAETIKRTALLRSAKILRKDLDIW